MGASLVAVTEGSGKNLETFQRVIGANTVEEDVVLNGEPYLATYDVVSGFGISAATAASHLIQVMAGSSLNVYIRRIKITQVAMATTAAMADLLLLRLTSAGTGGTVLTTVARDSTDAASGATAMTLPTGKGSEGAGFRESVYFAQTIPVSGSPGFGTIVDWDFDKLRLKPPRIAAGTANGYCVKLNTAIAAATVVVFVTFSEANF